MRFIAETGEFCRRPDSFVNFSRMRRAEQDTAKEVEIFHQEQSLQRTSLTNHSRDIQNVPGMLKTVRSELPRIREIKQSISQQVDIYLRRNGIL